MSGADITQIDAIGVQTVEVVVSEYGIFTETALLFW
jgi:hypothetical protein